MSTIEQCQDCCTKKGYTKHNVIQFGEQMATQFNLSHPDDIYSIITQLGGTFINNAVDQKESLLLEIHDKAKFSVYLHDLSDDSRRFTAGSALGRYLLHYIQPLMRNEITPNHHSIVMQQSSHCRETIESMWFVSGFFMSESKLKQIAESSLYLNKSSQLFNMANMTGMPLGAIKIRCESLDISPT